MLIFFFCKLPFLSYSAFFMQSVASSICKTRRLILVNFIEFANSILFRKLSQLPLCYENTIQTSCIFFCNESLRLLDILHILYKFSFLVFHSLNNCIFYLVVEYEDIILDRSAFKKYYKILKIFQKDIILNLQLL